MKKNTLTITLIVCAVVAAILLLAMILLIPSKPDDAAQNVQTQPTQPQLTEPENAVNPMDMEDYYCTLVIDTWSAENGKLTVGTFAQAVLPEDFDYTAQIELWKNNAVLSSEPITMGAGEDKGICEADVTVTFDLPEIAVDEELQLWLTVDVDGAQALFSCGGGWYLEDGQLMLITG